MKESKAKATARDIFYQECIPGWLNEEEIQKGNFLALLGNPPMEIPLLDSLGIARHHVWSVECEHEIYQAQKQAQMNGDRLFQGINLYRGDMAEYLIYLLQKNQRFRIMNLDIEGSFLNNLDPAMTSVLQFCWHNPRSILATYSTIGRGDKFSIWEGLKSLAIFLWLAPEKTADFFETFYVRYKISGFPRAAVHLVLRDLFWIRSVLEHQLKTAWLEGVIDKEIAERFFKCEDEIWRATSACGPPWKLGKIFEAVSKALTKSEANILKNLKDIPALGLFPTELKHVIYHANIPWSVVCYFVRFTRREGNQILDPGQWCEMVLRKFLEIPLISINRSGKRHELDYSRQVSFEKVANQTVCHRKDLKSFKPRRLKLDEKLPTEIREKTNGAYRKIVPLFQECLETERRFLSLKSGTINSNGHEEKKEKEREEETMKAKGNKNGALIKKGELTEQGKLAVKKVLLKSPATVNDVCSLLGFKESASQPRVRASIAAYLANRSRR